MHFNPNSPRLHINCNNDTSLLLLDNNNNRCLLSPIRGATISKTPPITFTTPTTRCRRRRTHTATALVAFFSLLFSTTAWLSLVFSGTTTRFWWHLLLTHDLDWEGSPTQSTHHHHHHHLWNKKTSHTSHHHHQSTLPPPPPPPPPSQSNTTQQLSLNHIVFGIAGSSNLWNRRKEFVRLWWRPKDMRGHVWLEEKLEEDSNSSLPPIMVSEDISRFRYTNPTGHPSGLRISRILSESFRLGLPDVRWFVLGDDDTIFNPDNLVDVLSKYDSSEMLYIGTPSESHSANTYFSHSMAFGGGGIAISYPLAHAISTIQDDCLDRYPKLYGSDDRLHACISELGVPLTREHGFHQWDIRGNPHGLLSTHPVAPFVSIHHVEAVDPLFPGLSSLESLKLFTRAMLAGPKTFLQRSICYDHVHRLTFSVSLGYVVQVYPNIVLPRELERSEQTYSAWNRVSHRNEFDFDTRDTHRSVCKKPVIFYLKDAWKQGNTTVGSYRRAKGGNDLKRRVFCFPRSPPLPHIQNIKVVGYPLSKNWHMVPRRLCSKIDPTNDEMLTITVRQCEKGAFSSVSGSV